MEDYKEVKEVLISTGYIALNEDVVCKVIEMGKEKCRLTTLAMSDTEAERIVVATELAKYEFIPKDIKSISKEEFDNFKARMDLKREEMLLTKRKS